MNLVIVGPKDSPPTVAFRLEQDGNDINVYAGDTFVGWFQLNVDGKIEFRTAYISDNKNSVFARTEDGDLIAN